MTSPKAPDNNTINARLAVAFDGYKWNKRHYHPGLVIDDEDIECDPPAYTDSLALAVELAENVCAEKHLRLSMYGEPGARHFDASIYAWHGQETRIIGTATGKSFSSALSLALYAAARELGLIKEEQ